MQMNWTNLQEIEEKIVEKRYSDEEAFHYFLGFAILYTLSYFLLGEEYENGYKLVVIPALCLTIITSILSFKTYSKNGGTDFFKDYFALNWVISFRLFFLGFFFYISIIFIESCLLSYLPLRKFITRKQSFLGWFRAYLRCHILFAPLPIF